MKRRLGILGLVFAGLLAINGNAINDLSVREDLSHPRVVHGFIDDAVLVVEPYGGYALQSLYIKYSDKGQLGGRCVVTHQFELPAGARVNDLWLWIGDSIMQAKIFERKYAQKLWDTITQFKRDPALLKITQGQYDLSVYPLQSGSYRKVKIQYFSPIHYIGKNPQIEFPLKFLLADGNTATPLKVLFRTIDGKWGQPVIQENSQLAFSSTLDTLGKTYRIAMIPNVKQFSSLTLTFDGRFTDGWTSDACRVGARTYFSFSMYEPEFLKPPFAKSNNKKCLVGLDLSGLYGVDPNGFASDFKTFTARYFTTGDSVRIMAAGAGQMDSIPKNGWYRVTDSGVTSLSTALQASAVFSAKRNSKLPAILFTDGGDGGDLKFSGVEKLATVSTGSTLLSSVAAFNNNSIVTTYWHGLSDHLSAAELASLKASLDQFFAGGGVFVEFYAYNRGNANVAKSYFKNLTTPGPLVKGMLHGNPSGPIGHGFPTTFYYENWAVLTHSDTGAVTELFDDNNNPVVISKKIGKGRFILTSLWHMQDNLGMKKMLCTAELNLQNQSTAFQLPDVLSKMVLAYGKDRFSEAVLMSNSDASISRDNLAGKIGQSVLNAAFELPHVKTIDLLDGVDYIPPTYVTNDQTFYGSSFCLDTIAKRTGGSFFARHQQSWDAIVQQILPTDNFVHSLYSLNFTARGVPLKDSMYDCNASSNSYGNPHFYLGAADATDSLTAKCSVAYRGIDSTFSRGVTFTTGNAIPSGDSALETMYQIEVLKRMLGAASFDTAAVVAFAIKNRLLTDVTAFIALEPNDTIHFMRNPPDESTIPLTAADPSKLTASLKKGFTFCIVPVGEHLQFIMKTESAGTVVFKIFTMAGRLVERHEFQALAGKELCTTMDRLHFAKGMYIAVAQFIPAAGGNTGAVQRKIERFIVK